MSVSKSDLDSMYGFSIKGHPPVGRECDAFDRRYDEAQCAACNAMMTLGINPVNRDLVDCPHTQSQFEIVYLDELAKPPEAITCPFPEEEPCHLLRRKKRPPSK